MVFSKEIWSEGSSWCLVSRAASLSGSPPLWGSDLVSRLRAVASAKARAASLSGPSVSPLLLVDSSFLEIRVYEYGFGEGCSLAESAEGEDLPPVLPALSVPSSRRRKREGEMTQEFGMPGAIARATPNFSVGCSRRGCWAFPLSEKGRGDGEGAASFRAQAGNQDPSLS